ncbi:hypothetical protein QFZ82_007684 [Streptomyces sp. V4I23]|uniref:hypothetical protein n=1 Tax=Streptomyces sp. V4I23 TaxID=3042282 RepID=UPI002780B77D|nr:hypothetical protein [Streptomyces sp. V4I23]MDQ1013199.1 hypothetical protein [Streptomyces sp. V4I23]
MAHEIEQFTDGTAAFASARESAWHGLGTITEGAMTAEDHELLQVRRRHCCR